MHQIVAQTKDIFTLQMASAVEYTPCLEKGATFIFGHNFAKS